MTDDLTRLATALGWEYSQNCAWKGEVSFDLERERDLDAFLKAAEAALTEAQRLRYGSLLYKAVYQSVANGGSIYYALATAPADVRLRALLAVGETT